MSNIPRKLSFDDMIPNVNKYAPIKLCINV